MKAIIFTETKVGEGHYQAARAIAHELEEALGSPIKVISGMHSVHPLVEWISVAFYLTVLRIYPPLWRRIYYGIKKRSKLQTVFFAWRLRKVVEKEQPDLVLCTHPACVSGLEYLKRKMKTTFKLATVCTDFDFHPFLVSPQVDYFFVSHSNLKRKLTDLYGIDAQKIFDYGIPVRSVFDQKPGQNRREELRSVSEQKIHLLLLGGAFCLGPIEEILAAFKAYQNRFHLTIITGKNKKLYKKLSQREYAFAEVLGYVENIHEWFRKADVVLSKPGGLTISETLASGKHLIIFQPIPGHEEANKNFLQQEGLALYVHDIKQLPLQILDAIQNETEWLAWQDRISTFQQKESAKRIVNKLILG